jgi:hypothetical protein
MNKAIFLSFFITPFIISSCNKKANYNYGNNATIIGEDYRTCPCCGGLKIVFDSNATSFKLVDTSFEKLGFSKTDTFPIKVKIDWKIDTTNVCNYIKITKLEKQ